MSYTNGIGASQQSSGLLAAASTQATGPADAVKRNGAPDASAPSLQQDAATLTSTGGVLAQAVSGTDTNEAKIVALQHAIATGTYSVSSSAVADKLIESMVQKR